MTVEALALVVTGAVGISAPIVTAVFAYQRQKREEQHQLRLRVTDELRSVLDDAALVLARGYNSLLREGDEWARGVDPSTLKRLDEAIDDAELSAGRLRLRLGQDSHVLEPFLDAKTALYDLRQRIHCTGGAAPAPEARRREVKAIQERFDAARTQFFAAGHLLIGSREGRGDAIA